MSSNTDKATPDHAPTPWLPRFLTIREAARYISVGRSTMQQMVSDRQIPVTRRGARLVRIDRTDLDAFMARYRY